MAAHQPSLSPTSSFRGVDALALPSITTAAISTTEYTARTKEGFVPSSVADRALADAQLVRQASHRVPISPTPTAVHAEGADAEKGVRELKIVTFKENDPEDPRQFSLRRKWLLTVLVSFNCFIVALGSSIVVMDLPEQAAELGCSIDVINLTVCLFVVGFGVGPLFFAPLSEQFGRTPIIIISVFCYWIFIFPSAFAHNAASTVAGRMFSGLGASAPMCLVGGSLADLWEDRERGIPLAIFSQTLFLGPTLGPVIGGFLSSKGWRANYYLLIGLVGLTLLVDVFFLPETSPNQLLKRRAAKLRKETGDNSYVTEQERFKLPLSTIVYNALITPLQLLVTEPIIILFTAYLSLIYGLLYILFFSLPILFAQIHGWSRGSTGLAFIPILLGMLSVQFTVIVWQSKFYGRKADACKAQGNAIPPEYRLPSMMICAPILPIGLFIFAWTSYADVFWLAPCIGTFLFGFAMLGIYVGANSYIVDSFPLYAASAMASKTFASRLVGAAMPMFVDRWYNSAAGPNWASTVLALISVCMMPVPFLFYKYGAQIRASSKRSS